MKKIKPKKITIKELDSVWSKIVRKKYNNQCAICGSPKVQAHHIFSRSYKSTRWNPDNGIALCYYHHIWFAHQKYEEFRDFVIPFIGEKLYYKLKDKSKEIFKEPLPTVKEYLDTLL